MDVVSTILVKLQIQPGQLNSVTTCLKLRKYSQLLAVVWKELVNGKKVN
jgi:hypothetical protein